MKPLLLLLMFCPLVCFGQIIPIENNPIFSNCRVNTKHINEINGHPTSYYLNNPKISFHAKAFYSGWFCIYDNTECFNLMDSVLTDNNDVRPFYFYVFNRIIELSDGAVSEVASEYCKSYLEKYPCEFLNYISNKEFSIPLDTWTMFVGFMFDSTEECNIWLQNMDKKVANSCPLHMQRWDKLKPDILASVNN